MFFVKEGFYIGLRMDVIVLVNFKLFDDKIRILMVDFEFFGIDDGDLIFLKYV